MQYFYDDGLLLEESLLVLGKFTVVTEKLKKLRICSFERFTKRHRILWLSTNKDLFKSRMNYIDDNINRKLSRTPASTLRSSKKLLTEIEKLYNRISKKKEKLNKIK